jgi:methylmalonyl-CoA/ethylmalonyl-CoA epimerase
MDLDHVALASRDSQAVMRVLVQELGATVMQGAIQTGFRPVQLRLGDAERGMTLELLEPYRVEEYDFLERFLVARGPGPHHLTFKVDDLAAEIDRLRAVGLQPTGIFLDSDRWKECFVHPSEAHGTVVQLAQGGLLAYATYADHLAAARAGNPYGEPVWWDDPGVRHPVTTYLERVVITTPHLDGAVGLYTGVFDGVVAATADGWADVVWPGGCVRFVADADRPAGVVRLECSADGPPRTVTLAGTDLVVTPA